MLTTKSYAFLAILAVALTVLQNVQSIKTEDDIVKEIQSMANTIKTECTRPNFPSACKYLKNDVDNANTLQKVCTAIDLYIVCQDTNCLNKSVALTQVLNDAMVIPFCGPLLNYPQIVSIISDINEMVKLCSFVPGQNCDQQYQNFITSRNKMQRCSAIKLYTICLEQNCQSPSPELSQKIRVYKNNTVCDLKIQVEDISTECLHSLYDDACETTKKAVENAETLKDVCVAMQTYAVCQDLNCFSKTYEFKAMLTEAQENTNCRLGKGMKLSPRVETVLSNVNDMMDLCTFQSGQICYWKDLKHVDLLTSLQIDDVCQAQKSSAECMSILCLYTSYNLQQKIKAAENTFTCASCDLLQVSVLGILMSALIHYL